MDRQLIEKKIEAYANKLLKKTDYKINFVIVSKTKPDLDDIRIFMIESFLCPEFVVKSREKTVAFYRQIFATFASIIGYKDEEIAKFLDKDRTTIIHCRRCILNYLEIKDPVTTDSFNLLYNKIAETYGKNIFGTNPFKRYYPE